MNQGLWGQSCPNRRQRPAPGSEPPRPSGLKVRPGGVRPKRPSNSVDGGPAQWYSARQGAHGERYLRSNGKCRLKTLYRKVAPVRVRRSLHLTRERIRSFLHETRWSLLSPQARVRWTEARICLQGYPWLFVLGCNSSGTSLLATVLARHPRIRALPREGQKLTPQLHRPWDFGVGRLFTSEEHRFRRREDDDASTVQRIKYDWAAHLRPRPGVILEKSPPDCLRARWLQRNFAPPRFLILVRHPYAVCEGIRRRRRCTIEAAVRHWARVYEILEEDTPHLLHVHNIHYEGFCNSPVPVLRAVEDWLGLPAWFSDEVVAEAFKAPNIDRRPQPICSLNSRSFARLSPEDVEAINRVAAHQMARFGYRVEDPAGFPRPESRPE